MIDDIIDKDLQFYSFIDFFKKKDKIKEKYKTLSIRDVQIYKMYVYSLCFETEHIKDIMWEWLNDNEEQINSMIFIEYRARQRRNRRKYGNNKMGINHNDNDSDSF